MKEGVKLVAVKVSAYVSLKIWVVFFLLNKKYGPILDSCRLKSFKMAAYNLSELIQHYFNRL